MSKVAIGIIGGGEILDAHAPALAHNSDRCEVRCIAEKRTDPQTVSRIRTLLVHRKRCTRETLEVMTREIEMCAATGWHELRAVLGGVEERFGPDARWREHRQSCIELLKAVAPVLKANQCRINLEDHGDLSTFELVEIVEDVGPDVVGVNLDTANVLLFAEDPVMAAGRVAPYTHLTHAKDGILFFTDGGVTRQGRPPGGGVVDWPGVLEVLAEHNPEMPISIEDHKWLFEVKIFENAWHEAHGRVSTYELSQFVRLAAEGSRKLMTGELPDAAQYESIPFVEQMGDRLSQGRTYLQGLVAELGLR